MYNEIIKIGPITVYGYGLMIGIGVICAIALADYRAKKYGMDADHIYTMSLLAVVSGFVGGKILFIITELGNFIKNPISALSGSGFVVYGGIILAIIALYVYSRYKKLDFFGYIDLLMPSVAIGQGFGRIGCLLAGCCYGRVTDGVFGITFTNSSIAPNGMPLMPTQPIMSIGNFIIALILLLYSINKRRGGKIFSLYLLLYSVGRFAVEFLRNDPRGNVGILSTSQFIAILMFLVGVYYFFIYKGKIDNEEKVLEEMDSKEV